MVTWLFLRHTKGFSGHLCVSPFNSHRNPPHLPTSSQPPACLHSPFLLPRGPFSHFPPYSSSCPLCFSACVLGPFLLGPLQDELTWLWWEKKGYLKVTQGTCVGLPVQQGGFCWGFSSQCERLSPHLVCLLVLLIVFHVFMVFSLSTCRSLSCPSGC